MQIIYGGKTTASQPHGFQFPKGFCLSQNSKHWSNEQETLKLIDEVINLYLVRKSCKHDTLLPTTRPNSEWISKEVHMRKQFIERKGKGKRKRRGERGERGEEGREEGQREEEEEGRRGER